MNTIEKMSERGRSIRRKEDDFLYNRFVMLQWEYFFSFAISGLLLLSYFGYLSWTCGIAWIFISNVIAMLLVRIDVTVNIGRLIESEKHKNEFMISSLN